MILMVGGSTAQLTPARSADEWSKLFLREAASEVHSRFQNECQQLRPELNRLQPWRKSAAHPLRTFAVTARHKRSADRVYIRNNSGRTMQKHVNRFQPAQLTWKHMAENGGRLRRGNWEASCVGVNLKEGHGLF